MSIDRPAPATAVQRAVQAATHRPLVLAATTALTLTLLSPASALAAAAAKAAGDNTPIDLGSDADQPQVGAGGGGIARVIVGLLVVVGVIYGVTWLLKQVKKSNDGPTGSGLEAVTTMPLQGGAALSLVRVGDELLLLGSGANGATALRRYEEDEARALGLWPDDAPVGSGPGAGGGTGNVISVLGRTFHALRARTVRDTDVVVHNASVVPTSATGPAAVTSTPHSAAPATYTAPGTPVAQAAAPATHVAPGAAVPAPSITVIPTPAGAAPAPAPATPASRLLDRVRAMTVRS